jgi:crossover junction endodeoxyribonuclease RusA
MKSRKCTVQVKTQSELNNREHWRPVATRAKNQRGLTAMVVRAMVKPRPQVPCVVLLRRVAPGELDDDNLQGALKHVRDGVADALGVDDADKRVLWKYEQRRVSRRRKGALPGSEYAVEIEIIEARA